MRQSAQFAPRTILNWLVQATDLVAPRVVGCPTCGNPVPWSAGSPFRPFCSERCKLIDLGAWADERYRIAAADPADDEPDADTPAARERDD